ncbi:MAG: O-antigen ligase family protein [Actinomycetes bacterium]
MPTRSAVVPTTRAPRSWSGPVRLGWPLWICTAGIPLAAVLGVHGIVWVLPALVLGPRLLVARTPRVPWSVWALAGFLVVASLGALEVRGVSTLVFGYRWLVLLGAWCAEVWLCTVPPERLSTDRVVRWVGALWICLVAFGWAAMLVRFDRSSPLQSLLPSGIRSAGFVHQLTAWQLAEVQQVAQRTLARPSAPFGWANGWGSAFAITLPCFVRSCFVGVSRRRRAICVALALAGLPPMLASLNRGLWMIVAVLAVVVALRSALRGNLRAVGLLVAVGVVVVVLLTATPLGGQVAARLSDTTDSNDARAAIYQQAWSGAWASPVVGHGAPTEVVGSSLPPVGTHGLLWNLLWSFGPVATLLFVFWLLAEVLHSAPARAPGGLWLHLSLLAGLLQVPIYGLLPQVVLLGVVAGLVRRDTAHPTARSTESPNTEVTA